MHIDENKGLGCKTPVFLLPSYEGTILVVK